MTMRTGLKALVDAGLQHNWPESLGTGGSQASQWRNITVAPESDRH